VGAPNGALAHVYAMRFHRSGRALQPGRSSLMRYAHQSKIIYDVSTRRFAARVIPAHIFLNGISYGCVQVISTIEVRIEASSS
jgi:hypothetical protein